MGDGSRNDTVKGRTMTKFKELLRLETGQSIVLIALLLMFLLAMAGLAIDGGNLFLQRRNVQNAADAAAMAGTRQLAQAICDDGSGDAEVANAVARFADLNGVEDLNWVTAVYVNMAEEELGTVGAGSIPVGATGVNARIKDQVPTYFMRVLGFEIVDVSALATAMTGSVLNMTGLRPIGVPETVAEAVCKDGAGTFTLNFGNCDRPDECIVEYTGIDGELHEQHRGWLNLAYVWNPDEEVQWERAIDPSGDANVLKDWMANGFPDNESYFQIGDYIHAKPGRDSSVIKEAPKNQRIVIPIFDGFYHYDVIPTPKAPQAAQGGGYYYRLAGFLTFEVVNFNQGRGTIEGACVWNTITATGQVGGDDVGYGQPDACWAGLQGVNLWR
jgi:hypothetical protein